MDTAQLLADLKAKGAEVELYSGSFDSLEVRFTAGEVKSATAREASGIAVRAIKDGKQGFVGSRDTSQAGLERLLTYVDNSLEVGDDARFAFPVPQDAPCDAKSLGGYDASVAELTVEDLVATGREAVEALRKRHPDVVIDASLRRSFGTTQLINSNGVEVSDEHSVYSLSIEANRTRDEDVLMDYAYTVGIGREGFDPRRPVEELSERLTWAETTVAIEAKTMPVLFTPGGSLVIWSPFFQGVNGKTVMVGTSPLRDRLGEAIFAPEIQVTDDGLLPGGMGSAPFDDEGTPRRTRVLVENGVLKGFVHDLETARDAGHEPTGNGERGGVTGKPGPGFTNVLIRPGDRSLADMLAGIDYGLLIHSVIGMGQGNTLPGTFSNPVDLAYLIEGGEVKGRVKDVSIAGNTYELLLSNLGGLSSEVKLISGTMHVPWMLLNDVNVVGKSA